MLTSLQVLQYSRQCGIGSTVRPNLTRLVSSSSLPHGQGSKGLIDFIFSIGSPLAVDWNVHLSSISFGISLIKIVIMSLR